MYYTWKNIKSHTKIINLKYHLPRGMKKFELPDGSYSLSNIQDFFECIIKKHEEVTDNPPITFYINKIENKITFKIKAKHYLGL